LLSTKWYAHPRKSLAEMTAFDAVAIGLVQGLALTPGISRSGSTIAIALLLGVNRELAGRFSFLILIPAICGALLLTLAKLSALPSASYLCLVAVGTLAACFTGYLTLRLLLRFVRQGKLYVFAPYCYLIGIGALVLAWWR
jgi:undecaprenyl-diphosphatase